MPQNQNFNTPNLPSGGSNHNSGPAVHDYLSRSQISSFEEAADRLKDSGPNFPSPDDLLPKELSTMQLAMLVESFSNSPGLRAVRGSAENQDKPVESQELAGLGTLTRVGGIEYRGHKVCYELVTQDGKHMAVKVVGYDNNLGMQVPQDPSLTVVSDGPTHQTLEYSQLKTHFIAPIGGAQAVELQEWGGQSLASSRKLIPLGFASLARLRAWRDIQSITGRDRRYDSESMHELRHDRNVLVKPGHILPAVTDVPVVLKKGL